MPAKKKRVIKHKPVPAPEPVKRRVPKRRPAATPPAERPRLDADCTALRRADVPFDCCDVCHDAQHLSRHQYHGVWYDTCCEGWKAAGKAQTAEAIAEAEQTRQASAVQA
jgi:hypothetical protein